MAIVLVVILLLAALADQEAKAKGDHATDAGVDPGHRAATVRGGVIQNRFPEGCGAVFGVRILNGRDTEGERWVRVVATEYVEDFFILATDVPPVPEFVLSPFSIDCFGGG